MQKKNSTTDYGQPVNKLHNVLCCQFKLISTSEALNIKYLQQFPCEQFKKQGLFGKSMQYLIHNSECLEKMLLNLCIICGQSRKTA